MTTETHSSADPAAAHHHTIDFRVRYLGAKRPFEEPKAPAGETLAQEKPTVLEFFKLKEGPVEGGIKTYLFSQDGVIVTDLNQTLGTLAQGHHELKLDLLERFEQG